MNITEANDTNGLLRYLLGVHETGGALPDDDEMLVAAQRLAARINAALHTGVTPEQVAAAWPGVEVCPAQANRDGKKR